jgi:hypothetical protein
MQAWGIAPGIQIAVVTSAESALQSGGPIELVRAVNCAFSAGAFWVWYSILGRRPRLPVTMPRLRR